MEEIFELNKQRERAIYTEDTEDKVVEKMDDEFEKKVEYFYDVYSEHYGNADDV